MGDTRRVRKARPHSVASCPKWRGGASSVGAAFAFAVVIQIFLPGCTPSDMRLPAPSPRSVEPSWAKQGQAQRVRILGQDFYLGAQRRFGWPLTIDNSFSVRVGGVALEEVDRRGEGEIFATLPDTLGVGTWDLEVEGPTGTGLLSQAITIIPNEICAGGVDEDADGQIDCADSECSDRACDDGDGCTSNDTCTVQGACVGTPCTAPSPCHDSTCQADACVVTVRLGETCSDGRGCTATDVCREDGVCSGVNTCQAPPTQCHQATGTCHEDSTCSYTVAVGGPCDDGVACTWSDSCSPSAACAGVAYSCEPPSECFTSACDGLGGCTLSAKFRGACGDGGVCLGDGGCEPIAWPYQPSNFQPGSAIPGPHFTIPTGCSTWFNSTANGWQNWQGSCGAATPPPGTVVTMPSGGEAVLFNVWNFTVQSGGLLNLFGDRPVIFAAFGDVRINGQIRANTSVTNANGYTGAGANPAICGSMVGVNATSATAGGGGGAFGGVGASGGGVGAGAGGMAGTAVREPLRGGCPGGKGGGVSGGLGGSGGGAVQISARGLLEVTSTITASGSGAKGATGSGSAGGGGGGSGGMILLEGNTVNLTPSAILTANGGGGGSGEGQSAGKSGDDGSLTSITPAAGGGGSTTAGGGGSGGVAGIAATAGAAGSTGGSGGGGAGVGVIIVRGNPNVTGGCTRQAGVTSPLPVYLDCQ